MAALFEKILRMGFLKIAGTDLGRGDVRGDGEHRHARPVAIEEAVDQVQVARPAAAGADRERVGQMRLRTRRERGDLLIADMHPFDLALAPDRVGQAVQAVADNPVHPLDTDRSQGFSELVSDRLRHVSVTFLSSESRALGKQGSTSSQTPSVNFGMFRLKGGLRPTQDPFSTISKTTAATVSSPARSAVRWVTDGRASATATGWRWASRCQRAGRGPSETVPKLTNIPAAPPRTAPLVTAPLVTAPLVTAPLVKEVALKMGEHAGDGTATATVLAEAVVHEGAGRWIVLERVKGIEPSS